MRCVRAVPIAVMASLAACAPPHDRGTDVTVSLPSPPSASAPPPRPSGDASKPTPPPEHAYADCVTMLRAAESLSGEPGFVDYRDSMAADRAGQWKEAYELWLKIVNTRTKGPFAPFAYLGFGYYFREAAAGNPSKWGAAIAAFEAVKRYPDASVRAVAQLELGRARAATGDHAKALDEYKMAIEEARTHADICGPNILEESPPDVARSYAKVGAPERAYAFFDPLYEDPDRAIVLLSKVYREANEFDSAGKAILPLLKTGLRTEEVCGEVHILVDQQVHSVEIDQAAKICRGE